MNIINQLQAYRQELCDITNNDPENNKRGQRIDRVISAIDNLVEKIQDLENSL